MKEFIVRIETEPKYYEFKVEAFTTKDAQLIAEHKLQDSPYYKNMKIKDIRLVVE